MAFAGDSKLRALDTQYVALLCYIHRHRVRKRIRYIGHIFWRSSIPNCCPPTCIRNKIWFWFGSLWSMLDAATIRIPSHRLSAFATVSFHTAAADRMHTHYPTEFMAYLVPIRRTSSVRIISLQLCGAQSHHHSKSSPIK